VDLADPVVQADLVIRAAVEWSERWFQSRAR